MGGFHTGELLGRAAYLVLRIETNPAIEGGEDWKGRVSQNFGPLSCPYSPKCVEGEFCEVQMQHTA